MKLLREFVLPEEIESVLQEDASGEKSVMVKGIFAQADVTNRNKRIYPAVYMDRELAKLQQEIKENRLVGELDHPEKPQVNLQNAAIKILKLEKDQHNYLGEAKIMRHTPKGAIAYGLAAEGIKFGASTRSLGSLELKEGVNYVKEDLNWMTVDLVHFPSAPMAYPDTIMEQMEYMIENGLIKEVVAETYIDKIKKLPKAQFETGFVKIFEDFLKDL